MLLLSFFGTSLKTEYRFCLGLPCQPHGHIPFRVFNSFHPERSGTLFNFTSSSPNLTPTHKNRLYTPQNFLATVA